MLFGPPMPFSIQAQPWCIPSSNWAKTANSGLKPPRVKLTACSRQTTGHDAHWQQHNALHGPPRPPRGLQGHKLRIAAAIKLHKAKTHCIRFTVGGNCINYKGKFSTTSTANLETIEILLDSTVSTPNAKMLTANIEQCYLGTPMDFYEYMRIPAKDIPANIMEQYNLSPRVHNGHVLTEIRKGMYYLPQASILAYNRLVKHLALSNYTPVKNSPGLFHHATSPVAFSLVVDDFAIKYDDRVHAKHLLSTLWSLYVPSKEE